MRRELVKIGYNVEKKTYGLDDIPPVRGQQHPVSRPVRGDSSATLGMCIRQIHHGRMMLTSAVDERYNTSSSKRKRPVEDDPFPENEEIEQELAQGEASYLSSQPLPPPRQSQPMQPPVPHLQSVSASQSRHFPSPAKQLQPEPQSSRPVQMCESRDWRAHHPRGGVRRHEDSLPAIQSMRLSSAARPRQPPRGFAASPNVVRARIAPQQRFQEPRIDEQQYVRPPPFPPAGMYFRTPTPHRDDGRPQQNDFHLDLAYHRLEAPTRRQDYDQPASSVISPFFRGSGGPAQPPTRAYMAPPATSTIERGFTRGPLFSSEAQYGSVHNGRADRVEPLSHRLSGGGAPQRAVYQSTTGSELYPQRSYRRAAAPMLSPTRAESPIAAPRFSQSYRTGRITLPPGPNSQRGWDPQVSQIRGVRGAGPATLVPNRMPSVAPPRPVRGPLYSQAGNRNVVRR